MAEVLGGVIRALPPPDDPPHRRVYEVARRLVPAARFTRPHFAALCEVAEMMAERLGLPPEVHKTRLAPLPQRAAPTCLSCRAAIASVMRAATRPTPWICSDDFE